MMMTESVNFVEKGDLLPLDRIYPNRLNPNEMEVDTMPPGTPLPLGERILLEWARIYTFRSPACHKCAVHINGATIANIHLATSEAVITYNQTTKKPEYINPTRLQNF